MAEAKETASNASSDNAPHIEIIDRIKNIPVIQSAIEKTGSTYTHVKESHDFMNWLLNQAEAGFQYATSTAAPYATPFAKRFEGPINAVDQKLCEGLNIVEQKVPIVKEPPQQIYDAAKAVLNTSLQPTMDKLNAVKESASQQVSTLQEISVKKANELLNTEYGGKAVQGVDSTSILISRLLDRYFPPVQEEEIIPAPVSADENKVLHAVQTIGQLSEKTARRVYHSIMAQMRTVKSEDVASYISIVTSILHLTYILSLNQKENIQHSLSPTEESKK